MTPEPDFSMPFNINAVTHAFFGILFVNTVFFLSKDQVKPDDEENKEKSLEGEETVIVKEEVKDDGVVF